MDGFKVSEELIPNRFSLKFLLFLIVLLTLANIIDLIAGSPIWPITRHIYLGSESNVATWFSSILLAIGGLSALQCADIARRLGQAPWFYLLALLLFGMSCDEMAGLHETIFVDLAKLAEITEFSFARHAPWVWIGGPVIAAVFLGIAWVMRAQMALVPGTMLFFGAGLAMIFLGGVVLESTINFLNFEELRLIWKIEVIVEETLEMIGSLVVVQALVKWRDDCSNAMA